MGFWLTVFLPWYLACGIISGGIYYGISSPEVRQNGERDGARGEKIVAATLAWPVAIIIMMVSAVGKLVIAIVNSNRNRRIKADQREEQKILKEMDPIDAANYREAPVCPNCRRVWCGE